MVTEPKNWWILRPGRKTTIQAVNILRSRDLNAWTPSRIVQKRDARRGRYCVAEPLLPGLLFCEGPNPADSSLFDNFTWALEDIVFSSKMRFYRAGGKYALTTEKAINKLKSIEKMDNLDIPLTNLKVGDFGELEGFIFDSTVYQIKGWQGRKLIVSPENSLMTIQVPPSIFRPISK